MADSTKAVSDTDIVSRVQSLMEFADMSKITKKKVRQQLEIQFKMDLRDRKPLISETVDAFVLARAEGEGELTTNGVENATKEQVHTEEESSSSQKKKKKKKKKRKREEEPSSEEEESEGEEVSRPAPKKRKKPAAKKRERKMTAAEEREEADLKAALALQAQVGRPRRRVAVEASARARKKVEGRDAMWANIKKSKKPAKPMWLSEKLQSVLGVEECSRGDVVKRLWVYIKEHNLQNPANKQEILCDDSLKDLFDGRSKVTMFSMNKYLSKHIKRPQDLVS